MNKNTFCTIITGNYYPYAQALIDSLIEHSNHQVVLEVFVSDKNPDKDLLNKIAKQSSGLYFTYIDDIVCDMADKLYEKYHSTYMDAYRWSMKPIFINYLIKQKEYEKVLYLDSDLYFYSNPDFLFDLLNEHRVLLSPHWRCADNPELHLHDFALNFQHGIYNGGFVGVNKFGLEVMNYWSNLCLASCEINLKKGFYVDQKHLDILHSRFDGVGVLRHRGCNLSLWNVFDCKRTLNEKGEVVINNTYPVVFIHFTVDMMAATLNEQDPLLRPHFEKYAYSIKKYDENIDFFKKANDFMNQRTILLQNRIKRHEKNLKKRSTIIGSIRYKLKIGRRIKRFIYLDK